MRYVESITTCRVVGIPAESLTFGITVPGTSPGTGYLGYPGDMPSSSKPMPRIVSVAPAAQPLTLRIGSDTAKDTLVNVSGPVNTYRFYGPSRENEELFTALPIFGSR